MKNRNLVNISWEAILKIGIGVLSFYFLYLLRQTLLLIIFALFISVLVNPLIEVLQRMRVSRIFATSLVFVLIFGIFGFSVYLISKAFLSEIRQFRDVLPRYFDIISPPLTSLGFEVFENIDTFVVSLEKWLSMTSEDILTAIFVVFGGVFVTLFVFFLAFFFSIEGNFIQEMIKVIFPKEYEKLAQNIWYKSQQKIIGWFGVKVLLSFFVGLVLFLALKLFQIKYALSLSLFAGINNIIPFVGPIFVGLVITIFVVLNDWLKAIFVLAIFILTKQIEEHILGPILTKKFIGLPPSLVLISLVIGGQLFGFLGVILAIPLAGILFDFLKEFLANKEH